jgi:hypothetical protein
MKRVAQLQYVEQSRGESEQHTTVACCREDVSNIVSDFDYIRDYLARVS